MSPALMMDLAMGRSAGMRAGATTAAPIPMARPATILPPLNRSSNKAIRLSSHSLRFSETRPVDFKGSTARAFASSLRSAEDCAATLSQSILNFARWALISEALLECLHVPPGRDLVGARHCLALFAACVLWMEGDAVRRP